VYYVITHRTME